MLRALWLSVISSLALMLFVPMDAAGYCLNKPKGQNVFIRWNDLPTTYYISDNLTDETIRGAIERAFQTFSNVPCSELKYVKGGADGKFKMCTKANSADCPADTVHYDDLSLKKSKSVYIFWITKEEDFPAIAGDSTTPYSHNVMNGMDKNIVDVGIAINAFNYQWNAEGGSQSQPVIFDVQNVMTFLIGYASGLSKSMDPDSVMFDFPKYGETSRHELSEDDKDGLVYLYWDKTCPEQPSPDPSSGCSGGTNPPANPPAPSADGGGTVPSGDDGGRVTPTTDGGGPSFAAIDGGTVSNDGGAVGEGDDDGGCGCRLARHRDRAKSSGPGTLLMLAVLGLAICRRKKRR